MDNASLPITLSLDSVNPREGLWLTLDQDVIENPLTMGKAYQMFIRARSGLSARTYRPPGCEVEFNGTTALFSVSFNVLPSMPDLQYSLGASFGTVSERSENLDGEKEFGFFFDNAASVTFDRIYSNLTFSPITPAYNGLGQTIPDPHVTVSRETVSVPDPIFAAYRAKGTEQGTRHFIDFEIDLEDEAGNATSVSDVSCTVTATWIDGGATLTEQLTLVIPECTLQALTLCKGRPNLICQKCEDLKTLVYYNTCNGEILQTRTVNLFGDQDTWCLPSL